VTRHQNTHLKFGPTWGIWAVESNHGLHQKDGPRDGKQYTSKSASGKGKAHKIRE